MSDDPELARWTRYLSLLDRSVPPYGDERADVWRAGVEFAASLARSGEYARRFELEQSGVVPLVTDPPCLKAVE